MGSSGTVQLRSLRDYCGRIPGHRPGSRTHVSTLIRWATLGVKTADGQRVRLRAVRAGSKWLCADEWFEAFISTLTDASMPDGSSATPPARTPAARRRASERAAAALEQMGA